MSATRSIPIVFKWCISPVSFKSRRSWGLITLTLSALVWIRPYSIRAPIHQFSDRFIMKVMVKHFFVNIGSLNNVFVSHWLSTICLAIWNRYKFTHSGINVILSPWHKTTYMTTYFSLIHFSTLDLKVVFFHIELTCWIIPLLCEPMQWYTKKIINV